MNSDKTIESTITTTVESRNSICDGQATLANSSFVSLKYFTILSIIYILLAGQEGLEPPASGFGDRRSTIRATVL
jgi:hypothetical protein